MYSSINSFVHPSIHSFSKQSSNTTSSAMHATVFSLRVIHTAIQMYHSISSYHYSFHYLLPLHLLATSLLTLHFPCVYFHSVCDLFHRRGKWAGYKKSPVHTYSCFSVCMYKYKWLTISCKITSQLLIPCRCRFSFKGIHLINSAINFSVPLTHLSTESPLCSSVPPILTVAYPFPLHPTLSPLIPFHLVPIFLYWHRSRFLNVFLNVALHNA